MNYTLCEIQYIFTFPHLPFGKSTSADPSTLPNYLRKYIHVAFSLFMTTGFWPSNASMCEYGPRSKDCNFSLKPKTTKMSPGCGANKKNKNAKPTEYHNKTGQNMLLLALCSNRNTDKGQITFWPRSCRHEPQLENHRTNKSPSRGHVVLFRWVYGRRSFGESFSASWKTCPRD